MPAILIGLGGTGTRIVADVRRHIDRRVEESANPEVWKQQADLIRYLAIDTRTENAQQSFQPSEIFVAPDALNRFGIDPRVQASAAGDPDFGRWWPTLRPTYVPYLPGDYDQGAGQVRPKGRFAYHLHMQTGKLLVDAVKHEFADIENLLNTALGEGARQIAVYLIASLAGGTGSGMVLTLAHHLKSVLPVNHTLVGVFPLASIMEMTVQATFFPGIRANTDAALREIEYFQMPASDRSDATMPFLPLPGGRAITGAASPFAYSYLFARRNRDGKTLGRFDSYIRLIGECLATELFSQVTDVVKGVGDNFLEFFHRPPIEGRPITWASASRSSVRYPTDRIVQHLARRLSSRVLRERLTQGEDAERAHRGGAAAANAFFVEQKIGWQGQNPAISTRFRGPRPDGATLRPFVGLGGARWDKARRDDSVSMARETRERHRNWLETDFTRHINAQRTASIELLSGHQGLLVGVVMDQLAVPNGAGLSAAIGAAEDIVRTLTEQVDVLDLQIEGDPHDPPEKRSLQRAVEGRREESWWNARQRTLEDGFGPVFNRTGDAAKSEFLNHWVNYARDEERLIVARAARALLSNLLSTARTLGARLQTLQDELATVADALDQAAESDLGNTLAEGVLDVGVMDDVQLVDIHFGPGVADVLGSDRWKNVADDLMRRPDGIAESLRLWIDLPNGPSPNLRAGFRAAAARAIIEAASQYFEEEVDAPSVWDAMRIECLLRDGHDFPDMALQEAWDQVDLKQRELLASGQQMTNPHDHLVAGYIARKLAYCRERSKPFWSVDPIAASALSGELASERPPHEVLIVAYERGEFERFLASSGIDRMLMEQSVAALASPRETTDVAGRHSITAYTRQGVLPLHWLDENERNAMGDAFRVRLANGQQLYIDRRFYDAIEPVFAPRDNQAERQKYAIVAGVLFDLVSVTPGDEHPVVLRLPGETERTYRGIVELDDTFERNSALWQSFSTAVQSRFQRFPEARRSELINDVLAVSDQLYLPGMPLLEDEWWKAARRVITRRKHYGQYQ